MSLMAPLPTAIQVMLGQNTHPGLMLDKYVKSWDPAAPAGGLSERVQRPALDAVVKLSQQPPDGLDLNALLARREQTLAALQAQIFRCTTTGPLTLHLARASALENAGICLHPLYGFVCLPGTGLKGMARAYAETVWKPAQLDQLEAKERIEEVCGNKPAEPKQERQRSGAVVFHDAWPTAWPKLIVDILNNHHSKYYQGEDAPGDWENPVPVYFLAVPAGATFEFALALRGAGASPASPDQDAQSLLDLAKKWLLGALCHLGAGAKTNSGYGSFRPVEGDRPALTSSRHATFDATLELVTPAFLAGASQQADDCDLRPATLRGLLRWWWRTMHAGFVDVETLRAMEAAIWGDTVTSGAVKVEIFQSKPVGRDLFNFKNRFEPKPDFKRRHGLADRPNNKTTQGLFYASYGMDETSQGKPKQRFFLDSGSRWTIRLIATPTRFFHRRADAKDAKKKHLGKELAAFQVMEQATAALWLLCNYGSVGSKSRKGFGSLQVADVCEDQAKCYETLSKLGDCRTNAASLRESLRMSNVFNSSSIQSSGLGEPATIPAPMELEVPWDDPWRVMDEVGFAYQAFAQSKRHDATKAALGLPRKIHGPRDDGPMQTRDGRYLQDPEKWQPPEWLDFPKRDRKTPKKDARHSSPIHIHIAQVAGKFVVRALVFPAAYLPDFATSLAFLQEFLLDFEAELRRRAALQPPQVSAARPQSQRAMTAPAPTSANTKVRVKVLAKHTLPNSFKVQEEGENKKPGILQYGKPPAKLPEPGETIEVYRNNNNPQSPQFRWDPPPPPPTQQRRGGGSPRGR